MTDPYKDAAANDLLAELRRTGVISESFKNQIMLHLDSAIEQARSRGYRDGYDTATKMRIAEAKHVLGRLETILSDYPAETWGSVDSLAADIRAQLDFSEDE